MATFPRRQGVGLMLLLAGGMGLWLTWPAPPATAPLSLRPASLPTLPPPPPPPLRADDSRPPDDVVFDAEHVVEFDRSGKGARYRRPDGTLDMSLFTDLTREPAM